MPRGKQTVCHGFTLIEILIVVVLLGIIAMMVGPATQSMLSEARVNAVAGEIAGALEYASSCTVRYQRSFAVGWIPALGAIAVCDRRHMSSGTAYADEDPAVGAFGVVRNPFDKMPYTIELDDREDARGISLTPPARDLLVVFYPDGHVFTSSGSLVVALGNMQRIITIAASTGRVAVK